MEASWNRIRTISGAETAEDVVMYWEGLKAKEEQVCSGLMHANVWTVHFSMNSRTHDL